MDKDQSQIFKLVEGLEPVDPNALKDYEKEMAEAIPAMIRDVEKRRMLAAEGRHLPLEMPTDLPDSVE